VGLERFKGLAEATTRELHGTTTRPRQDCGTAREKADKADEEEMPLQAQQVLGEVKTRALRNAPHGTCPNKCTAILEGKELMVYM
jgi:hypothetical protein